MTFLNVLSSVEVLIATALCGILAVLAPFLESQLRRVFSANNSGVRSWIDLFAGLMRAIILIGFVILAYPAIFGLSVAPTIKSLVVGGEANVEPVVSILFLIGFAISIMLDEHIKPEVILPAQACLAAAYAFLALSSYLGVTTATLWPGTDIFAALVLVAYFAHRLAYLARSVGNKWLGQLLESRTNEVAVVHTIGLLAQIPMILLYGYGLGRQLAI